MKREEYYKNPLLCERCGSAIPFEKRNRHKPLIARYCGNSCSTKSTVSFRTTAEVKAKMLSNRKINHVDVWTPERRKVQSARMKQIVNDNPKSYSSENVCGRVKTINIVDSYGNETKCLGKWEFIVSEFLNKSGLKWTNDIDEVFEYVWDGSTHRYFPDFKLPDKNVYIEVKGFERERDREKWKAFPHKLIVIRKADIKKIKAGTFDLDFIAGKCDGCTSLS